MMMKVCLFLLFVGCATAVWEDAFKFPWTGVPWHIATTIGCPDSETCYVACDTLMSQEIGIYKTSISDFRKLSEAPYSDKALLFTATAWSNDGKHGVIGGAGLVELRAIAYTDDSGAQWKPSADWAFLQVNAFSTYGNTSGDFAWVGNLNNLENIAGWAISQDGGKHWRTHRWKQVEHMVSEFCGPAGGVFWSDNEWLLYCGGFPIQNPNPPPGLIVKRHGEGIERHFDGKTGYHVRDIYHKLGGNPPNNLIGNYSGGVLRSSDGGHTWKTTFNSTYKFATNSVNCNGKICLMTAYGSKQLLSLAPGARIFRSEDMGMTWKQVWEKPETWGLGIVQHQAGSTWYADVSFGNTTQNVHIQFIKSTDDGKTWALDGSPMKGLVGLTGWTFAKQSNGKAGAGLAFTDDKQITALRFSA
eukprot:TRINITY_DN51473_c0_g1_i1.p2 TRINITY_DN51473_c0_g1~~TRINITY_DN51473_c0_g1_i1.p2  ORF type:complete len:415 (-),score=92.51 TRINITY_DN51473_c0_g1_i1:1973-3217(-)